MASARDAEIFALRDALTHSITSTYELEAAIGRVEELFETLDRDQWTGYLRAGLGIAIRRATKRQYATEYVVQTAQRLIDQTVTRRTPRPRATRPIAEVARPAEHDAELGDLASSDSDSIAEPGIDAVLAEPDAVLAEPDCCDEGFTAEAEVVVEPTEQPKLWKVSMEGEKINDMTSKIITNICLQLEMATSVGVKVGTMSRKQKREFLTQCTVVELLNTLNSRLQCAHSTRGRSVIDAFVSNVCNVGVCSVSRCRARVGLPRDEQDAAEQECIADDSDLAMHLGTMAVVSNAVKGRPHADYLRDLALIRACKPDALPEKCLNWTFPRAIEYVTLQVVRRRLHDVLDSDLPALGIKGDFTAFMDGGTIGRLFRSCRSSLLVLGVTLTVADTKYDEDSDCICIDALPCLDGRAEAVCGQALNVFNKNTWHVTKQQLAARLAAFGADGEYAEGEPDAQ